jgi:uncharacterized MnhB-related membrane protein
LDKGREEMILILLIFTVICAIGAITVKDLLGAVVLLGAVSFFMCLLWTGMGAVDVALQRRLLAQE